MIAISQDSLGRQGRRLRTSAQGGQVWARPLAGGAVAVALYNSGGAAALDVRVTWAELGLSNASRPVRDVLQGRARGWAQAAAAPPPRPRASV